MKKGFFILVITLILFSCNTSQRGDVNFNKKKNWIFRAFGNTCRVHFFYKNRLYATSGEYTFIGSPNRYLYCLNPSTGKVLWSLDAGAGVTTRVPVIIKNKIYWGPIAIAPWFLNPFAGERVSSIKKIPKKNYKKVILHNKSLSIIAQKKHVTSSKIFGNKWLFINKKDRSIYAYNIKNGKKIWHHKVRIVSGIKYENRINFSYIYKNGVLFIGHYDGMIEAVVKEE